MWWILMLPVLSAAGVLGTQEFDSVTACFNNCTCRRSKSSGTAVDCGGKGLSDVPSNLPADAAKLNFTATGLRQVSWDRLASLGQLTNLYLESNPLLCDCKFYKFWKKQVAGDGKVKVYGTCNEPGTLKNSRLQDAGEALVLKAQCQVTSSSFGGIKNSLTSKTRSSAVTLTEKKFVTEVIQPTSNVNGKLLPSWTGQSFMTSSVVHTTVLTSSALAAGKGGMIERKSGQSGSTSLVSSVTKTTDKALLIDASSVITDPKPEEPSSTAVTAAGVKAHVDTSSVTLTPRRVIRTTDIIEATSSTVQSMIGRSANSSTAAVVQPPVLDSSPGEVPMVFTSSGLPVITSRVGAVDLTSTAVSSKTIASGVVGLPVVPNNSSSALPLKGTSSVAAVHTITEASSPASLSTHVSSTIVQIPPLPGAISSPTSSSAHLSSTIVQTPPLPTVISSPSSSSDHVPSNTVQIPPLPGAASSPTSSSPHVSSIIVQILPLPGAVSSPTSPSLYVSSTIIKLPPLPDEISSPISSSPHVSSTIGKIPPSPGAISSPTSPSLYMSSTIVKLPPLPGAISSTISSSPHVSSTIVKIPPSPGAISSPTSPSLYMSSTIVKLPPLPGAISSTISSSPHVSSTIVKIPPSPGAISSPTSPSLYMSSTIVKLPPLPGAISSPTSSSPHVSSTIVKIPPLPGAFSSPTTSSAHVSSTIVETPPLSAAISSPSSSSRSSSTVAAGPVIPVGATSSPVAEKRSSSVPEVVVTPTSPVVSSVSPKTEQPTTPGEPEEPVILQAPEDITVDYGERVSLICEARGNPKPAINFNLNGKPAENYGGVDLEKNENQLVLRLPVNLTSQVECVVANKLGSYRVASTLTVNSKSLSFQVLKLILIGEDWDDSLSYKTSPAFRSLALKLENQVRSVLGRVPDFVDAKVLHFSPGSVKAEVLIKIKNSSSEAVKKAIDEEVKESHVGRVAVDRYRYSLESAKACSEEFLNITWSDATFGSIDIQLCPRGAKGFAKRSCSETGLWGWPDYTGCHSDNFLDVKEKFSMMLDASSSSSELPQNQAVVQNMVISLMGDLVNVTTPHKEHAVMAGDITIATDIISQLVNFTRVHRRGKASGDEEIQRVLDIASNLLDGYNVQEFIVAQKVIQTASKLIAQLELYGLQAAPVVRVIGKNSMALFISENVVLGARTIERPSNVTEDVVFPESLQNIKKTWNATSFIILRKDTIRKIKPGKNGNLMACFFLYKTLTRILSIESAFGPAPEGMAFELNSAVISSSLHPKPGVEFSTPIEIASTNIEQVELEQDPAPICSFWDFELNAPHGGWSDGGCYVSHYNMWQTTCHCNHMTNFAVLREVPLPVTAARRAPLETYFLCIYIGCWVFLFWAVLTFIVLLLCCRNLKPDYTWIMHLMVCATLIVAFALILVGLDVDSYNRQTFCNLLSILVHYFYLCAFSWIMAEGVYMHKWSSIGGPKRVFWVWYIAIGWLLPGVGCALAWAINGKSLEGFDSPFSCWMSLINADLVWTFFSIAFVLTLVSILVFRLVWRDVVGPLRVPLKSQYWKTRFRVHVRYSIILQFMFLFTWLLGILLTTYPTYAILCVLFIIFCFITGFLIFLFYCLMDRQVRDSSRSCFCFCRRKKQGKYWVNDEYNKPTEEEGLVPAEKPDQNEKAVEMNNFSKKDEVEEEPLLTLEAQPVDEEAPDGQLDHVYAKVDKSKKNRNVSEDSNDPIGVAEPRTRLYSGLTRAEVIRMAKKSDASRDEAKQYLTPEGSRENLADQEDTPTIMYTPINQEELDEELRQFRSFFAQRQSKKFASTSTPAVSRTTTTVTTTTVVKTKKNVVENGTDDVFENGIEGSSPEEPSSPKEPRGPTPPGVEQIQTNVRQETHVEETVTTSVVVRASDLHALELLAASEDGAETKTDETGVTPSQDDQPAPSRTEGQDFSLFLDDDDLMEAPPPLPTTKYDGDAVVEDDFTSTIYEKDENVPDLDILEAVNDQESPDLTTVTEISTVTVTTVEKGTDDSKEQNADGSLMDDVMTYFTDRDKAEGDEEWGRLVKDLQDTG